MPQPLALTRYGQAKGIRMRSMTPLKLVACTLAVGALLVAGPVAAKDKSHGWLGVSLQDLSPSEAKVLQLQEERGVLVSEVIADSPAQKAGLKDGDVIVSYAGEQIETGRDLSAAVKDTDPGSTVDVVVVREGVRETIAVEIGERTAEDMVKIYRLDEDGDVWLGKHDSDHFVWHDDDDVLMVAMNRNRGYLGVHLDDLSEQLGEYFEVENGEGALITEVVADSPAASAKLEAGDVIVKFGDEQIASTAELHAAIAETEPEQEVELTVVRKGRQKNITATLGEMPDRDKFDRWEMAAPHMKYRHFPKAFKFHAPGDEHEIIIQRMMTDELDAMKELGQVEKEMEKLREEMKELQKEMKELKKTR
jgi:membrane-associated protease RseP (regulator of RpoE activity)